MTNVTAGLKALGQAAGVASFASGMYTGDGAQGAISVKVGFTPRYVKLINLTDLLIYEYVEGLPATDTLLTTGSTGDITVDTNSAIVTNMVLRTATEVAYPAPGAQSPDDGVNGTVSVTYEAPDQSVDRLVFNAGSSGAITNVNAKAYLWMAFA